MGIGYGGKAMAKVFKDAPELKEADHPHNLFIEVTLGLGIPGLLLLLWVFTVMLKGTLGKMGRASDPFERELLLGLGMAIVGVIVGNLFDHIFAKGMAHLLWVVVALAMGVGAAQERRKAWPGPSSAWRLAA
jgi:O-antigen ligase